MANLNNSTVNHLMDESNKKYDMGLYEHAIQCLIEAWDLLPGDKYPYDESYYIIRGILDVSIQIHDEEKMRTWVEHILYADPERIDSGEREMWVGKVACELKEYEKAYDYMSIAHKKSLGRCFYGKNRKYIDFWKKYKKMNEAE